MCFRCECVCLRLYVCVCARVCLFVSVCVRMSVHVRVIYNIYGEKKRERNNNVCARNRERKSAAMKLTGRQTGDPTSRALLPHMHQEGTHLRRHQQRIAWLGSLCYDRQGFPLPHMQPPLPQNCLSPGATAAMLRQLQKEKKSERNTGKNKAAKKEQS